MPHPARSVPVARATLRLFLILNLAFAIAAAGAILASFPFAPAITGHLTHKYGPAVDAPAVLRAMRLLLGFGLVAVVFVHRVFAGLLAILRTVSDGDPFTAANADRLARIGWALLALQLLDLTMPGFERWFAALHVEFATWSPALGGWIAVLMCFVLASVFRRGAAMRDDLAATV